MHHTQKSSRRIRIAIVEDEAAIREMYQLKLELSGFEVATAANGIDGLGLIENFAPQLVLIDLRMPGLDGEEMLQQMREHDWGSEVRVVILTNISRDEAPSVLRLLGVDRYIVKAHYTPGQVVEVVEEVLHLK